jgi:hypothetical protein
MNAEPSSKLAEMLGALAIELQARTDPAATLRGIVDASVDIVPGARWAGISLIQGRRVKSEVPTDPIVAELDQLQTDLDEGPCISALRKHHTVHIEDLSAETRWPRFVRRATALGVRSMLSFQLFVRSENLGALNLHGDAPGVSPTNRSSWAVCLPSMRQWRWSVRPAYHTSMRPWSAVTSSVRPKAF